MADSPPWKHVCSRAPRSRKSKQSTSAIWSNRSRSRWPRSSAVGIFSGRSSGSSTGRSTSPRISCSPRRSTPKPWSGCKSKSRPMKADRSSQDNPLAFPLTLSAETTGPEVEGPTHFARALKRARFARGWTQARLAAQLAIPKRSIVSLETGERIPSIGMVVLLLDALFPGEELTFQRELITAYIVDDLERQAQRRRHQRGQDDPLLQRVQRVMAQVKQFATSAAPGRPAIGKQGPVTQADEQAEEREPSQ